MDISLVLAETICDEVGQNLTDKKNSENYTVVSCIFFFCTVSRVYVVNHRMPRGLFGWLLFYFMWPFRFTFGTLWNIFGFASKSAVS